MGLQLLGVMRTPLRRGTLCQWSLLVGILGSGPCFGLQLGLDGRLGGELGWRLGSFQLVLLSGSHLLAQLEQCYARPLQPGGTELNKSWSQYIYIYIHTYTYI